MKNLLPTLDATIADLWNVSTDDLIDIVSKVNKLAKKPSAGDLYTRLMYLWKDASISIMLTARPECAFTFGGVRPDGYVGATVIAGGRRTDVHFKPRHLSIKAERIFRQTKPDLPVVFPVLAERLSAALAAAA